MSQHDHADDPYRNLRVLQGRVDDFFGRQLSRHPLAFACRAGCDGCCQSEREVNDLEFDNIARAIAALPAEDREALARRAAAPGGEGPCSLLVDGRCAVYYDRPVICRSHGAPILMEGRRDVCPLNFTDVDLASLPDEDVLSVDTLTAIAVAVNALYCQETGGDAERRRPAAELLKRLQVEDDTQTVPPEVGHEHPGAGESGL
jgi:hypothetical protein